MPRTVSDRAYRPDYSWAQLLRPWCVAWILLNGVVSWEAGQLLARALNGHTPGGVATYGAILGFAFVLSFFAGLTSAGVTALTLHHRSETAISSALVDGLRPRVLAVITGLAAASALGVVVFGVGLLAVQAGFCTVIPAVTASKKRGLGQALASGFSLLHGHRWQALFNFAVAALLVTVLAFCRGQLRATFGDGTAGIVWWGAGVAWSTSVVAAFGLIGPRAFFAAADNWDAADVARVFE